MSIDINKYVDYYMVCEQTSPLDNKIEIIGERHDDKLSYLRFSTILQTFANRNRNQRLWFSKFVKLALVSKEWNEMLSKGGMPGECGHPIPDTEKATIERISTIDPFKVSHVIKSYTWENNDTILKGIIETVDDINGPGERLRRNVLQGLPISFSNRSLIPQRKNVDGTVDQIGVGRTVTFDRVYVPGHEEAYLDKSIQLIDILKQPKDLQYALESCLLYSLDESSSLDFVLDGLDVVTESMSVDKNGIFRAKTDQGTIILPLEKNIRTDIKKFMINI